MSEDLLKFSHPLAHYNMNKILALACDASSSCGTGFVTCYKGTDGDHLVLFGFRQRHLQSTTMYRQTGKHLLSSRGPGSIICICTACSSKFRRIANRFLGYSVTVTLFQLRYTHDSCVGAWYLVQLQARLRSREADGECWHIK